MFSRSMTYENVCDKMFEILTQQIRDKDAEVAHAKADDLLVEWLRTIGMTKLADHYLNIPKWNKEV